MKQAKTISTRFAAIALAACATFAGTAMPAAAQGDFPSRPLTLVAPYAAGGSADNLARRLANHLSNALGQPVVVENKPGGNTQIAASAVARAPADGYTLLIASNASMVLNPLLYKKLNYNPDTDLTLTNILAEAPLVLVTNPQTGFKTLADLQARAQAGDDALNYSSIGLGNPLQLTTELILGRVHLKATHIPYNGSAPALAGLIANDTQLMVDVIATALPQIKADKLVAIATTGQARSEFLPDTPTVAESGVPDFRASTWFGVALPAGTPADVKGRVQSAVDGVMNDPAFIEAVRNQFLVVQKPQSQAALDAFLASDREMWRKVIADNHIVLDN